MRKKEQKVRPRIQLPRAQGPAAQRPQQLRDADAPVSLSLSLCCLPTSTLDLSLAVPGGTKTPVNGFLPSAWPALDFEYWVFGLFISVAINEPHGTQHWRVHGGMSLTDAAPQKKAGQRHLPDRCRNLEEYSRSLPPTTCMADLPVLQAGMPQQTSAMHSYGPESLAPE